MAIHVPTRSAIAAVFLLLPASISADTLCTVCFTTFRPPGGADHESIGLFRINGCPCCQEDDCKSAAKRAQGLRNRYQRLREQYEMLNQEIAGLRTADRQVPRAKISEQAKLNFDLGQLELQYAILNAHCPTEVPGENVWDGLFKGPVEDSPAGGMNEVARDSRTASQAAASYDEMARNEEQEYEVITGFLNASAEGFSPPAGGYNGERTQATRGYRAIARAYRKEAEILTKGEAVKPNPKADPTKPIVPKFAEIKVAKEGEAYIRNAGIAARARLEGNTYILAYLQARDMFRQALAADNKDAATVHARKAVEFAWQAQGYSKWAADHQHKSDVVYQKLLDDRLAAADKKGLSLAELLKKFQSQVKESGLPAHLRDALTAAGATTEELAGVKERLLALTLEAVEGVLKERRARIGRGAEVPDALILETQLLEAPVVSQEGQEVTTDGLDRRCT